MVHLGLFRVSLRVSLEVSFRLFLWVLFSVSLGFIESLFHVSFRVSLGFHWVFLMVCFRVSFRAFTV